jgi:anti-sigma-K factor RskA
MSIRLAGRRRLGRPGDAAQARAILEQVGFRKRARVRRLSLCLWSRLRVRRLLFAVLAAAAAAALVTVLMFGRRLGLCSRKPKPAVQLLMLVVVVVGIDRRPQ